MQKVVLLCSLILFSSTILAKITPESVLGEYWKDPLFGEAAESQTVQIEILNGKIWPTEILVQSSETIRFVFLNKSKAHHLFAFSEDINQLIQDDVFQKFVQDEVFHAEQSSQASPRHHSHAASSVDDAEAIVKLLSQRPTVFVKPDDKKEILIRFSEPAWVELRCVIEAHQEQALKGTIEVLKNE